MTDREPTDDARPSEDRPEMTRTDRLVDSILRKCDCTDVYGHEEDIRMAVDSVIGKPTARTLQMSTAEGYKAWKASTEPPCTECGGGKGLGHTTDCPVAGDRVTREAE